MKKEKISVKEIQKKATYQLKNLVNAGNTRETASFVQSVAAVLNEQSTPTAGQTAADKKKSKEDKKESIKVNNFFFY